MALTTCENLGTKGRVHNGYGQCYSNSNVNVPSDCLLDEESSSVKVHLQLNAHRSENWCSPHSFLHRRRSTQSRVVCKSQTASGNVSFRMQITDNVEKR